MLDNLPSIMLERDPKRRRLAPLNAPFRSPLRRPSSSSESSAPPSVNPPSYATRTSSNFTSPLHNNASLPPEIKELWDRKKELQLEIKNEKKALETAELALKYEKQGGDENLEKLIKKWRACAQHTAERVFINARNRIDHMGGFKEFIKSQNQQKRPWDDSPSEQQDNDEPEQYDKYEEEYPAPEQKDEEEFTMEIMLRMAGVEEGILGWDRELNNFRKE